MALILAAAPRSAQRGKRGGRWHGAIPQWPSYHDFADQRCWLGVPHAADVLSNLSFALIGAWALWSRRRLPRSDASWAWCAFAAALIATAAGSALYHWGPDNASLVFDRLPIAWACAALLLRLARRFEAAAPDLAGWGVLSGYALANGFELADRAVFDQFAVVSGHTLEHLAAAGAAVVLVEAARRAAQRSISCGSPR